MKGCKYLGNFGGQEVKQFGTSCEGRFGSAATHELVGTFSNTSILQVSIQMDLKNKEIRIATDCPSPGRDQSSFTDMSLES